MTEFFESLPQLPVGAEASVILSTLVISIATALIALIRNRRSLVTADPGDGDLGTIFENPASVLPHVLELRDRIIRSVVSIVIGTLIGALITRQVFDLLMEPLDAVGGQATLIAIGVTEPFGVFFRVAIVVGIILASPFVITQLWIFVAAGLKPGERRIFYLFVPFAMLLFLAGVLFAYFAMLPVAVPFLLRFMEFNATPTLENYVKFVTSVLLWVGISFEMPLIVFGLAKLGVVNARQLAENWRIALVGIAVLAAVVTPTPDPINMGIVAAPLFVLYLLSILLAMFA